MRGGSILGGRLFEKVGQGKVQAACHDCSGFGRGAPNDLQDITVRYHRHSDLRGAFFRAVNNQGEIARFRCIPNF